jgi:hypothetical protein
MGASEARVNAAGLSERSSDDWSEQVPSSNAEKFGSTLFTLMSGIVQGRKYNDIEYTSMAGIFGYKSTLPHQPSRDQRRCQGGCRSKIEVSPEVSSSSSSSLSSSSRSHRPLLLGPGSPWEDDCAVEDPPPSTRLRHTGHVLAPRNHCFTENGWQRHDYKMRVRLTSRHSLCSQWLQSVSFSTGSIAAYW